MPRADVRALVGGLRHQPGQRMRDPDLEQPHELRTVRARLSGAGQWHGHMHQRRVRTAVQLRILSLRQHVREPADRPQQLQHVWPRVSAALQRQRILYERQLQLHLQRRADRLQRRLRRSVHGHRLLRVLQQHLPCSHRRLGHLRGGAVRHVLSWRPDRLRRHMHQHDQQLVELWRVRTRMLAGQCPRHQLHFRRVQPGVQHRLHGLHQAGCSQPGRRVRDLGLCLSLTRGHVKGTTR